MKKFLAYKMFSTYFRRQRNVMGLQHDGDLNMKNVGWFVLQKKKSLQSLFHWILCENWIACAAGISSTKIQLLYSINWANKQRVS